MAKRRCEFCTAALPAGARSNKRYCDEDCRRGRTKAPPAEVVEVGLIAAGTEESIEQATKEKRLGPIDAGAVAALRVLARKIDEEQARWDYCLKYAEWAVANGERPPKPPPIDNVSWAVYLNYCQALGLVPAGRKGLPGPKEEGSGRKLGGHLSAVKKPGA